MNFLLNTYRKIRFGLISPILVRIFSLFYSNSFLDDEEYQCEFNKHIEFLKKSLDKRFFYRIFHFLKNNIELVKHVDFTYAGNLPIVIVTVHDELDKLQLFMHHHKNLGFKNFIVLCHESPKEIFDYLEQEKNVCIYKIKDRFYSDNKCAWIQKVMAKTGYRKWYFVADCDELFDYIQSETYKINVYMNTIKSLGIKSVYGFMLDMYSKKDLYSVDCKWSQIPKKMNCFDVDSYETSQYLCNNMHYPIDVIWGGFRQRYFDIKTLVSKESLFYFDESSIYEIHYIHPLNDQWLERCYFVLRHYKFLKSDYEEFKKRASQENFAQKGLHYKKYISNFGEKKQWDKDQCTIYKDSRSLAKLPFLKNIFS